MNRKIAVMADIHSNHIALETCLKEAKKRGAEQYLFLGDYLGELAYPERTIEILDELSRQYPCIFIRGNREDYFIQYHNGVGNWVSGTSGSGMLLYVYERLTSQQIETYEKMPISQKISFPGYPPFVICHGSPWKTNESLWEGFDYIDKLTKQLETELTICAHFHIQCEYTRHGRLIVNPGSVGLPHESGGLTKFMMLYGEDGQWRREFFSLPYDIEKTIQEMDAEKLFQQAPGWYRLTKEALRKGTPVHMTALTKAHDLYLLETGNDDWSSIPEKYWDKVLAALNIP